MDDNNGPNGQISPSPTVDFGDRLADESSSKLPLAFKEDRLCHPSPPSPTPVVCWRLKVRMRTMCVGLVVALNIGVDPPDLLKTEPCAREECWTDINSLAPQKALHTVGAQLQDQYQRLHARARFKTCLDPTTEEVKRICLHLRRFAKDERVLIHYNGHGVPRPTDCGEIWVFNKNFTQYIPLSLYELQSFITGPCIFVWDCSNAGQIVKSYDAFSTQRRLDFEEHQRTGNPAHPPPLQLKDSIHLAACAIGQVLPMNPDVPADLFTACLTTPIEVAFRCLNVSHNKRLVDTNTRDLLESIPGKITDRKTMKGELYWIFTAITDTIAWNVLPRELFQKLFRQDLLVAALFRNFLLAERVMRSVNCTPVSHPPLPPTHQHPLWQQWDLAVELAIASQGREQQPYKDCYFPFFADQLKAFEVWLTLGSKDRDPPEQLPIVLQVLLSQPHRRRALQLLARFVDLGAWAVSLALSVGIFPYVLKLLLSPDESIRPMLTFIWCKILVVDKSCQVEIVKEEGERYFAEMLVNESIPEQEQTMAAFCLSVLVCGHPKGQEACLRPEIALLHKCLYRLQPGYTQDHLGRQWVCLALAKLLENFDAAKNLAIKSNAHQIIAHALTDHVPEVRAAAAYALGLIIGSRERTPAVMSAEMEVAVALCMSTGDCSPFVRKEICIALYNVVIAYRTEVQSAGIDITNDRERREREAVAARSPHSQNASPLEHTLSWTNEDASYMSPTRSMPIFIDRKHENDQAGANRPPHNVRIDVSSPRQSPPSQSSQAAPTINQTPIPPFMRVWRELIYLTNDPFPEVATLAQSILDLVQVPGAEKLRRKTPPRPLHRPWEHLAGSTRKSPSKTGGLIRSFSSRALYRREEDPILDNVSPRGASTPPVSSPRLGPATKNDRGWVFVDHRRTNSADGYGMSSRLSSTDVEDENCKIQSDLYEWSCGHFRHSLLEGGVLSEATEEEQAQHDWLEKRNTVKDSKGQQLTDWTFARKKPNLPFMAQQNTIQAGESRALCVAFHPYAPELVVADGWDHLTCFDWLGHERLSSFANGNTPPVRISDLCLVNAHDKALILSATDDGVVRVWQDYGSADPQTLTAWRALGNMAPVVHRDAGMVVSWSQQQCRLSCAGDWDVIGVWDANEERCIQCFDTHGDGHCVSTITHAPYNNDLLLAGYGHGRVVLFDTRLGREVVRLEEHKAWMLQVAIQTNAQSSMVSASLDGEIRIWDLRKSQTPTMSFQAFSSAMQMSAVAVHPCAPLIAAGTRFQQIKLFDTTDGRNLCGVQYHEGFLGQRIGPITTMSWHSNEPLLSVGAADGIVSVYNCANGFGV